MEQPATEPRPIRWAMKFAASAGVASIVCCVAPMVLFMFGLMGASFALSFAGFFYDPKDGSAATGAWVLRGLAVVIGLAGVWLYRRKQNQCSIDPARRRKNLILVTALIAIGGVCIFLALDWLSGWYFDKYIVPARRVAPPPTA